MTEYSEIIVVQKQTDCEHLVEDRRNVISLK